jgi:hypothetical protein
MAIDFRVADNPDVSFLVQADLNVDVLTCRGE